MTDYTFIFLGITAINLTASLIFIIRTHYVKKEIQELDRRLARMLEVISR